MLVAWSRAEVEATVEDYLHMLTSELNGTPYNKTEHRTQLRHLLKSRSDGAIERKHQNISAILIEIGLPYISGYKPLRNYQQLLYEVIVDRVNSQARLLDAAEQQVSAPATLPPVADILGILESPPHSSSKPLSLIKESRPIYHRQHEVNFLEREAHNSALGAAGELFALRYEQARLLHAGKEHLAGRVEHVALTIGAREGFDIRSFETSGKDRLIEVKTTAYGKETPFFLSRNELVVSKEHAPAYHLYRLFGFRKDPRMFVIDGDLNTACQLKPTMFMASVL